MSNKSSAVYMELRWGPFLCFCFLIIALGQDVQVVMLVIRVYSNYYMYDKRTKEKPKTDYKKGRMRLQNPEKNCTKKILPFSMLEQACTKTFAKRSFPLEINDFLGVSSLQK